MDSLMDISIWTPRRIDKVLRAAERNEAWAELHEWGEKIEAAKRNGWPLPIGGGLYKDRWALSQGQFTSEPGASAWDIDCMPVADFGNITAAATVRTGFNVFPLINPAAALGSPDPEPFQLPGGTLTAVVGDRQIGSSRLPLVVVIGAYVVHITAAAGVFQPAATTLNIRVVNAVTTVAGAFTTEATLAINAAVNFIDQVPITATTGRGIATLDGRALTNVFAAFNGDAIFAELVAGAAIQTNLLYAMLELV
jgi:hypothetical protein